MPFSRRRARPSPRSLRNSARTAGDYLERRNTRRGNP